MFLWGWGYPTGQHRPEEGRSKLGSHAPGVSGAHSFCQLQPSREPRSWMSPRACGALRAQINQIRGPVCSVAQGSKEMLLEWLETVVYFPLKRLRHISAVLFM